MLAPKKSKLHYLNLYLLAVLLGHLVGYYHLMKMEKDLNFSSIQLLLHVERIGRFIKRMQKALKISIAYSRFLG